MVVESIREEYLSVIKLLASVFFILYLWGKYRLCTNSAYSLFISSLSYVDFIPLLVGEYIFLRLFRRAPKESNDSSDGFFIDEPITQYCVKLTFNRL